MANDKYQSLIDNINGGVVITKHSGKAEEVTSFFISDGFTEMTGYTDKDMKELFGDKYVLVIHPEDRDRAFSSYMEQISKGESYRNSYRIVKKGGQTIWVIDSGYVVKDEKGDSFNHSILTDITLNKIQEEELSKNNQRFHIAIKASHATVVDIDLVNGQFIHIENAKSLLGFTDEQLEEKTRQISGRTPKEYRQSVKTNFIYQEDWTALDEAFETVLSGQDINLELRLIRAGDGYTWCKLDVGIVLNDKGKPKYAVCFITDISSIKRNTEYLQNQAQLDSLTGLYNKSTTAQLSDRIIREFPDHLHALMILDVDNFKGINDTLGHAFGDAVLMKACDELKALFRSDDVVGRVGGDEFAVFMKNVPNTDKVLKKAAEVAIAFRRTYKGKNGDYKISCSMGIVMCQSTGESYDELSRKADAALYQAKKNGKDSFVLYSEGEAHSYPTAQTGFTDEDWGLRTANWNIEERIIELLYNSKDFAESVNLALSMIGQRYQVSRAYVFENDNENLYTTNTYEWCNTGINAEKDNLQKLPIENDQESIMDSYDKNGLFYCSDVRTLPPYARRILQEQGICSTLQVCIVDEGEIKGFIGFDDCYNYREWGVVEVNTLNFLSKILGVFLLKWRAENRLNKILEEKTEVEMDLSDIDLVTLNPSKEGNENEKK